jgi:N-acyl-D-amino-acid deacylase
MKRILRPFCTTLLAAALAPGAFCQTPRNAAYDVIVRNGTVYDGAGGPPLHADIGIVGDRIVAIGDLSRARGSSVDARDLAVAPGFINMLSHSEISLLADFRSLSELRQGVTTQIFGESSMGPLTPAMKQLRLAQQGDIKYEVPWTTLAEFLKYLEKRGAAQNFASFVGAGTVREYVLGLGDVQPTPEQLRQMQELVRGEMRAGALGVTTALIYPPNSFAHTEELITLAKVASQYRGKYIAHIRSEANQFPQALDETIRIAREAHIPAEVYHFKAAGEQNWPRMDDAIRRIEQARRQGLKITADMYTYTAGATGLASTMPPWVLDGGYEAAYKRFRDPATRQKIAAAMRTPSDEWENMFLLPGSLDRILLIGFRSDKLKPFTGKTLGEVAKLRGQDPTDAVMDLITEDQSRIGTVYFLMSEENVKKQIALPWVSFGSDAASIAAEGDFLKSSTHPRAYGNFARLLGKYVREQKVISLAEAVHRLSGLPATNLELDRRGFLRKGYFADVVVFDPQTIADRATFENPHQYAVGVKHVLVNGVQVLKDGEHTGAKPGRALYGPGKAAK